MTPGAEYAAYRSVMAAESEREPTAWLFKSHADFTPILEHVSPEQGTRYIAAMQARFPEQWGALRTRFEALAALNDSVGMPRQTWYPEVGWTCSPTNLRYMCHSLLIADWCRRAGVERAHFIEIGGGYGGLGLFITHTFPARLVASYSIVDLPEPVRLQSAYANHLGIPLATSEANEASVSALLARTNDGTSRFVISNYAFSEFSQAVRDWYATRLIAACQHGFLLWNMIGVYAFTSAALESEAEVPLTGPGNRVVTF